MKKILVKVCVCNNCVMNGAIDIMEAIESLKKLRSSRHSTSGVKLEVEAINCTGLFDPALHKTQPPIVIVEDTVLTGATTENVMEAILHIVREYALTQNAL